jgi:hypothetical protein
MLQAARASKRYTPQKKKKNRKFNTQKPSTTQQHSAVPFIEVKERRKTKH